MGEWLWRRVSSGWTHGFTDSMADWLTDWLADCIIDWSVRPFIYWIRHILSLIFVPDWLTEWPIHSLTGGCLDRYCPWWRGAYLRCMYSLHSRLHWEGSECAKEWQHEWLLFLRLLFCISQANPSAWRMIWFRTLLVAKSKRIYIFRYLWWFCYVILFECFVELFDFLDCCLFCDFFIYFFFSDLNSRLTVWNLNSRV